jgi:LGFP repeat
LGSVGLITRPPAEGRPFGNFFLRIGLRGTGPGQLRYVYIYERGDSTPGVGPGGGGGGGGGAGGVSACGHTLGSGIYDKWQQLGGEGGLLRCAASDEAEAGASPQGTTGRYAFFNKDGNGGLIVWHGTGPRAGQAFEVHGCIFKLYQSLGGTGSWLGFPISDEYDEYDVEGGRRSDFENGFIFWNAQTRVCQALPYAE